MRLPHAVTWRVLDDNDAELVVINGQHQRRLHLPLGAGYVGSYTYTGNYRGRAIIGQAYIEYIDCRCPIRRYQRSVTTPGPPPPELPHTRIGTHRRATTPHAATHVTAPTGAIMRDELFSGFSETGWDHAPWDTEPHFSSDEMQILLNPALSIAEAAEQLGCARHDVERLRRTG